ncbi:hypothetical protein [Cellulomonas sp.]|uniref:hypothetical protein n=1 Tax=Cellulomonas sp. TaxID=40001 RepID=UPI0025C691B2|nr:hypothetical protein [Cellulomonas sp.]
MDPDTSAPTVVAFQYNPHTLTRSFEVQGATGGPEAGQLTGPPRETIRLELILDAADALEEGKGQDGVAPSLAALQGIVTPRSSDVLTNLALAASGSLEILPPPGPVTLFVWGGKRVLPVAVAELAISEEAHDASLNPTLARVTIALRVLSYADLPAGHPAHALTLANQVGAETRAAGAVSSSLDGVLGSGARLL